MLPPASATNANGHSSKSSSDLRDDSGQRESFSVSAPSVTLPKGGGAIRGIGEKFSANPTMGTGSMSLPIATSPGRSGLEPQLAISYDSGSGNGPFGFGWSLPLPAITRKTDKGLPQYMDAEESDAFLLAGGEDLVPVLHSDGSRYRDESTNDEYVIHRYRPRIESLFARIERWTRHSDGDVHWRSISKNNVLTLYGKDSNSRLADPRDPLRVFSWLISETRDALGNAVIYDYKLEDGTGVDMTRACERNRGNHMHESRAANRYLKRIRYGNRDPFLNATGQRPQFLSDPQIQNGEWLFEVVFDYGEHDVECPTPVDTGPWVFRNDPFSSYRAGFEIRTTRLCQRVLMFHHFVDEVEVGANCLVRSIDFQYTATSDANSSRKSNYSFLRSVTQAGYRRNGLGYLRSSMPPIEFEYSQPAIQQKVEVVDPASLENLPFGVDGTKYQWIDLHSEGIPGILSEQSDAWFYKRNITPLRDQGVEFAPSELVAVKPSRSLQDGAQFMDLAGDGELDLVVVDGPAPGYFEHDADESWRPFRTFSMRLNRNMRDPNFKFVDLNGDGFADVLITEDDAIVWHPSLGKQGFGPSQRVAYAFEEEMGPRLVLADGTQSIYLADLSGDGLTDLVRIRNGEICYWPNLGYGRFGAKVAMDNPPQFDHPDQFDHARLLLADIDGSGTTDIIYLHGDGARLYFNHSGNSWSGPYQLDVFPRVDDRISITTADLIGDGTSCLVWCSSLPEDAGQPMRYVNLMGDQKPHLLIRVVNNLGAETRVHYASSTRFYLQDKYAGKPWITKLPFPVHVVERIETYDHISRNRFVTKYAYHHGHFCGHEREFRGFGMVEQWDAEELGSLTSDGNLPHSTNHHLSSNVPPVLTRTWFHTGIFVDRQRVSDYFSGVNGLEQPGEYYREPGMTDAQYRASLLHDTVLPTGLTAEEEREACRSLKGAMLRQEIYALDGTDKEPHPYMVVESNLDVRCVQRQKGNRHGVFLTHTREAITYSYERDPADPRVQHIMTLDVDDYGNVLQQLSVAYGRRSADASLPTQFDRDKQTQTFITYTENRFTPSIDVTTAHTESYVAPLPCESKTYELTGFAPPSGTARFRISDWTGDDSVWLASTSEISYEQVPDLASRQMRLIEQMRTVYRKDDLSAMLPLGQIESLALPGESYKLAFTPGLLSRLFQRDGEALLPDPSAVLAVDTNGLTGKDRGGYVASQQLKAFGIFPISDKDQHWWLPSGRVFLSADANDTHTQELEYARRHFFLPHRFRDPFHTVEHSTESIVTYDAYDLVVVDTRDALGNRVTVGQRTSDGLIDISQPGVDYRVLQPRCVMDANRNCSHVAFDVLGMVVGTATLGKPEETVGDSIDGFITDLPEEVALDHLNKPLSNPHDILGRATSRILYDLFAYSRTKDSPHPQPATVYSITRETHDADLQPGQRTNVQHGFAYSDGFGREIQKKLQADSGAVTVDGPVVESRWVATGWTIFNNKGKPVRQYEPFFTATHQFELGVQVGVSAVLFYDPVERVVATLLPDDTYTKVVFDAWQQATWDANDTVLSDPRTDADIRGFTAGYFESLTSGSSWRTWHAQRSAGALGPAEQMSASKAAAHADTPSIAYSDSLGRTFLTVADNGPDPANTQRHLLSASRVELDIEGNRREVRDAVVQAGDPWGRIIMRYAYDMLGNLIHQINLEAGARWILGDIAGRPIRTWNSRGFAYRTEYDPLRRPIRGLFTGADSHQPNREILTDLTIYGDDHPEAESLNMRGKIFARFDQAGIVTTGSYDFKGNSLHSSRRIAREYKQAIDWTSVDAALTRKTPAPLNLTALETAIAPLVETQNYMSQSQFDAMNRPVTTTSPDGSIFRPRFKNTNLLDRVDVNLRGRTENGEVVWTAFVTNIDYDAKGQRQSIVYGNGVRTTYEYDRLTYRLIKLRTRRDPAKFPDDCPQPAPVGWPGCQLQNLTYTYDPVGNVTRIRDDAQQTIFFRNRRVEPTAEYTYDAMYRLIEATGREHLGQIGGAPIPHSSNDAPRAGRLWSENDGHAMGTYVESYSYDPVGNLLEMRHRGSSPVHAGWTRSYAYNEVSLIENGSTGSPLKTSNRLSHTVVAGASTVTERYMHDAHGNMTYMPHLGGSHPDANMHWDHRDQLCRVDLPGNGTAYYTYDAGGQRTRKVIEHSANLVEERFYLGGFEVYRRQDGSELLERETLHVMDNAQRIAIVETRIVDTASDDKAPSQLIRFQIGNHLCSACLELDALSEMISYEEYAPYGSTTYSSCRSQRKSFKRYRYTGTERDEETGLSYHSARYYVAWLGQWSAVDPLLSSQSNGTSSSQTSADSNAISSGETGLDAYIYGGGSPIKLIDISGETPKEPNLHEQLTIAHDEEQALRKKVDDLKAEKQKWVNVQSRGQEVVQLRKQASNFSRQAQQFNTTTAEERKMLHAEADRLNRRASALEKLIDQAPKELGRNAKELKVASAKLASATTKLAQVRQRWTQSSGLRGPGRNSFFILSPSDMEQLLGRGPDRTEEQTAQDIGDLLFSAFASFFPPPVQIAGHAAKMGTELVAIPTIEKHTDYFDIAAENGKRVEDALSWVGIEHKRTKETVGALASGLATATPAATLLRHYVFSLF